MKKLITCLALGLALFTGGLNTDAVAAEDAPPAPTKYADLKPSDYQLQGGDSGDTAWMIVATVLVLLMTIPGLSLFYGGLVGRKNVLSVLVQCFAITCVMTILWVAFGYGWSAEAEEGNGLYYGVFGNRLFMDGLEVSSMSGTMPESVWITFQMTFAIITPALIVGAFAERMKFSAVMIFMVLWFTLSYVPIWHMVWQKRRWPV